MVHPLVFFGAIALMGLGNGMVLPNANAGMMSVRPELAGTASGLGGALAVAVAQRFRRWRARCCNRAAAATPPAGDHVRLRPGRLLAKPWVLRRERQSALQG